MNHRLTALINSPWRIADSVKDSLMAMLLAEMKSNGVSAVRTEQHKSGFHGKVHSEAMPYVNAERETWAYDYYPVKIGSVAVIPVMNIITQEDYFWGIPGTKTIGSWYMKAANDAEIKSIIELSNSPGGQVLGTNELATLKASIKKPITTVSEGLVCSAAYELAVTSREIFATSENVIAGSVGVMLTYVDFSKMYAEAGITVRDIYATTSPLKNNPSRQAEKGNDKAYQDELLNPSDDVFMRFVQEYRPQVKPEALNGQAVLAQKGVELGLLDGIKSFAEVLEIQGKSTTNPAKHNLKSNTQMKHLWVAVLSLFGVAAATKTDGTEKTEQELANEAHALVSALQGQLATAKSDLATAKSDLTAEKTAHETTKASLTEANEKVTAFEKLPPVERSQARKEGADPTPEVSQKAPELVAAEAEIDAFMKESGYA